ncbi:MAG: solute-binding protein [Blautia sp.]|nr:solute-binding protein [Blautia sp.]MDD7730206.1 solute-binding protein [Clostridia bacterium]MDY5664944.1 solute-binding protein [Blautia sp.]
MGNTRDQVGKAGLVIAGGVFRTALYICVAVLIFWGGKTAYQFGYNVFDQQAISPGAGQEVTVVIQEGSSVYDIGRILESKGLIEDAKVFYVQEKLSNYRGKLNAGTYLLSTAYTPTRIMGILAGDEEQEGVSSQ